MKCSNCGVDAPFLYRRELPPPDSDPLAFGAVVHDCETTNVSVDETPPSSTEKQLFQKKIDDLLKMIAVKPFVAKDLKAHCEPKPEAPKTATFYRYERLYGPLACAACRKSFVVKEGVAPWKNRNGAIVCSEACSEVDPNPIRLANCAKGVHCTDHSDGRCCGCGYEKARSPKLRLQELADKDPLERCGLCGLPFAAHMSTRRDRDGWHVCPPWSNESNPDLEPVPTLREKRPVTPVELKEPFVDPIDARTVIKPMDTLKPEHIVKGYEALRRQNEEAFGLFRKEPHGFHYDDYIFGSSGQLVRAAGESCEIGLGIAAHEEPKPDTSHWIDPLDLLADDVP